MNETKWFHNEESGQYFDLDVTNVEGIKVAKMNGAVEVEGPPADPSTTPTKQARAPKGSAPDAGTE